MGRQAKAGQCLKQLVIMAVPVLQAAERQCPRKGRGAKLKISGLVDRGVDYVQRAQKEEDEIGAVSVSAPAAVGDRYLAGRPAFSFASHLFSPLPPRPSVLSRGGSPSGPTSHRRRSDRSATHGGGQE